MNKHNNRLINPDQSINIYRAKTAYQKFLTTYPWLRKEIKQLQFSSTKIVDEQPWLECKEGDVHLLGNAVFVYLDPDPDPDDVPVGPTGPH